MTSTVPVDLVTTAVNAAVGQALARVGLLVQPAGQHGSPFGQPVQRSGQLVSPSGRDVSPSGRDGSRVQLAGRFAVACSGGADSMALAEAAIQLAGAARVTVVTIDHGLQSDSAEVAARVSDWARSRGSETVVRRVAVARGSSLEAAARDARYAALDAIADEHGLARILLGHTATDQAETVLMRMLRGTGPAGLSGIPAERGRYVRPLLSIDRETTAAYAAAHGLPIWTDPMNADVARFRTRIRTALLPALRRENPQLDAALVRLAASTAEWTDAIDAVAAPLARLPLDCVRLAAQPIAIRKRALAIALESSGLDYASTHLDDLDRLVTAPARGEVSIDVPGGRAVRSYDALALVRTRDSAATSSAADSPSSAADSPSSAADSPSSAADSPSSAADSPSNDVDTAGWIPPAGPYAMRIWAPGDRMRPARLRGRSRKLSDLFIDAKVPRAARRTARVVVRTTDSAIVWAEHLGIAFGEPESVAPVRSDGGF